MRSQIDRKLSGGCICGLAMFWISLLIRGLTTIATACTLLTSRVRLDLSLLETAFWHLAPSLLTVAGIRRTT